MQQMFDVWRFVGAWNLTLCTILAGPSQIATSFGEGALVAGLISACVHSLVSGSCASFLMAPQNITSNSTRQQVV
jgi:hypothetical protein